MRKTRQHKIQKRNRTVRKHRGGGGCSGWKCWGNKSIAAISPANTAPTVEDLPRLYQEKAEIYTQMASTEGTVDESLQKRLNYLEETIEELTKQQQKQMNSVIQQLQNVSNVLARPLGTQYQGWVGQNTTTTTTTTSSSSANAGLRYSEEMVQQIEHVLEQINSQHKQLVNVHQSGIAKKEANPQITSANSNMNQILVSILEKKHIIAQLVGKLHRFINFLKALYQSADALFKKGKTQANKDKGERYLEEIVAVYKEHANYDKNGKLALDFKGKIGTTLKMIDAWDVFKDKDKTDPTKYSPTILGLYQKVMEIHKIVKKLEENLDSQTPMNTGRGAGAYQGGRRRRRISRRS